MFKAIYLFEWRFWLRTPSTYIYFMVLFCFSLISFLGAGSYFDESNNIVEQTKLLNSPYELYTLFQYMGKLLMVLIPAIVGNGIYNDFRYKMHPILFSFPINHKTYLSAKFLASFSVLLLISTSPALGFLLGEFLLGIDNPFLGPFIFMGYLQAYGMFIIPNLLVFSVFVFTIVATSRNIYNGFVAVLLFFMIQILSETVFVGNHVLMAILDPFGQNAVMFDTRFWTLVDRNRDFIPWNGLALVNRFFYLTLATVCVFALYKTFKLSHASFYLPIFQSKKSTKSGNHQIEKHEIVNKCVQTDFSFKQTCRQIWAISSIDFRFLVRNPMFYIFASFGLVTVVFMLRKVTNSSELVMLPLTRIVLAVPTFFYLAMIIFLTFIYAGMLIHRGRTSGMDALINVTPVSNMVMLISKLIALVKVQYLLLLVLMFGCMALQLSNDFYNIEIGLYLFYLFIICGLSLFVWSCASIFIHALIPNFYLGVFILVFLWVGKESLLELGINSYLIKFNAPPMLVYSDINGYGAQLKGYFLVQFYWVFLSLFLLLTTLLFWKRENLFSFFAIINQARKRIDKNIVVSGIAILFGFFICGFFIFRAELLLTKVGEEKTLTDIKHRIEQYKNLNQPRIVSIDLTVNIYPEEQKFDAGGKYIIINKTSLPIDTLMIRTGFDEITTYKLHTSNNIIFADDYLKFFIHKLGKPLAPNDTLYLDFAIKNTPNNLFQLNSNVLANGTFLKQDFLPRLGYNFESEQLHPNVSSPKNNHYQAVDSDLIDFQCIVSTSKGQTALVTGDLIKKWQNAGRNYFHYKTPHPIKMGMAINSGNFEVYCDSTDNIPISVYYDNRHAQNIRSMVLGVKSALYYNTQYFTPYQYSDMKIIEFPLTDGSYATAFGNAILTSEVRFGTNAQKSQKIDLAFYVSAHEMTHHWFGNQLMPKACLGANMLTESITEYISLKIYEKHFGKEHALQFLKVQRERYLKGRSQAVIAEAPLYLVSTDQEYISYGKGALAFNALAHYLGEEEFNCLLQSFLYSFPSTSYYYPTSIDFVKLLKSQIPEDLHYLIKDMFEDVVFYDAKIKTCDIRSIGKEFEITVDFIVDKFEEKSKVGLPLEDYVEIGFYDSINKLLHIEKVSITDAKNSMIFKLKDRPSKVVIDPNLLLIEKEIEDNAYLRN